MKLTIEKLGRIQKAEVDIRPLTVLIGPNNTNKTWTAYVLYGLLQSLSRKLSVARFAAPPGDHGPSMKREERLREALRPLLDSLADKSAPMRVDLSLTARSLFLDAEQEMTTLLRANAIGHLLGVPQSRIPDVIARIEFLRTELQTSIVSVELAFERSLGRLQVKTRRSRRSRDGRAEESSILVSLVQEEWTERKILDVLDAQTSNLIENVVVFPAERNGILPIWPLIPESDHLDIPLPVKDFGRFLAVAQTAAPVGTMNVSQNHLALLLKKVVGGEISSSAEGETKRLIFRTGSVEVPLHAAASLSRAVAGLSLYIERFFQPDDVLIIDELEMNAHPQAQVALTEFIAALVNAGVRVVFTTYSPYVVDHLNNLMEASRAPEAHREELARKFSLGTTSSFISPEKVSVYAFQEQSPEGEVTVQDVLNRQTGLIDWSTFSRVSEHITNLYSDVLRATEGDA
ncbi:ATP-binding protein [Cystobacter fuscus]|uniref:AAA family ATPase n=1 Tax=Cystobacter fuscus TaxID=43 RepID=UPI002B318658|nr:ATP-binding protein [Cystobacter fuscus]